MIAARDPLGRGIALTLAADFAPLGVKLHLQSNSPDVLQACRASFGRYGVALPATPPAEFSIHLAVDPSLTETPPWPDPVVRGRGDLLYISVGRENTAVADLDRRRAVGFITPDMARSPLFLRSRFLECLMLTMATHGAGATHTYVHASAVAHGDRGLVFAGPPESGKSTLAYAMARHGFSVVTDDVVYLADHGYGLMAWGKPWRLRFLPDCVRFFPELSGAVARLKHEDQGVAEVELEEYLPGRVQTHCRPVALFFLDRRAGPVRCEALDPDRAVQRLAGDLLQDQRDVMQKHRLMWARLAEQGAYVLRYNEDLDSAVSVLGDFLGADPRACLIR